MRIIKKGMLTTLQDLGRFGFQSSGVNPSGAMDLLSARLLNLILGNHQQEAVLEMHFPGPLIEFEENCYFALTGADFDGHLNQQNIVRNKRYFAKKGDQLSFKRKLEGERSYFGVRNGFVLDSWLNSKSFHSQLDVCTFPENLKVRDSQTELGQKINFGVSFGHNLSNSKIRFVSGFEYQKLEEKSKAALNMTDFVISKDSNRMGYRLNGFPIILGVNTEMISAAVGKGTIQLLPNGQLIVLMADAQVSGGYPKLGFVIENDISKLAQLGAGAKVIFEKISYDHALEIMYETERTLYLINKSLRLRENEN